MLTNIMLFWIGSTLNAPTWYWVIWWIATAIYIIRAFWHMFKAGMEAK